jgi:putative tricarboxylic transport membrane protein
MIPADAISGLLLAAIGIYTALTAYGFGLGTLSQPAAGFFPFWASVLMVVCSTAVVARAILPGRGGAAEQAAPGGSAPSLGKVAACVAMLLGYAVALPLVGFAPSTFLVMLALSRLDSRTSWPAALLIAVLGFAGFWLVFVRGLAVKFPSSPLGF